MPSFTESQKQLYLSRTRFFHLHHLLTEGLGGVTSPLSISGRDMSHLTELRTERDEW